MDVRRREPSDLGACARVLAEVHRTDGYPVDWPERPEGWLSPSALLDAWVAEHEGVTAGHVALSRARARGLGPVLDVVASDTAAVALYERLGWSPLGSVEQRWGPGRTVTVRCYAAPA
ncbi:hypothetical protein ACFXPI_00675 [Streptomyces sp. NPDC059104]|uniref:hypothetical protein n=1 Tax=Streptomyces sp. NPDC059104 TaxID=3346729 RepID=UPI0036C42B63